MCDLGHAATRLLQRGPGARQPLLAPVLVDAGAIGQAELALQRTGAQAHFACDLGQRAAAVAAAVQQGLEARHAPVLAYAQHARHGLRRIGLGHLEGLHGLVHQLQRAAGQQQGRRALACQLDDLLGHRHGARRGLPGPYGQQLLLHPVLQQRRRRHGQGLCGKPLRLHGDAELALELAAPPLPHEHVAGPRVDDGPAGLHMGTGGAGGRHLQLQALVAEGHVHAPLQQHDHVQARHGRRTRAHGAKVAGLHAMQPQAGLDLPGLQVPGQQRILCRDLGIEDAVVGPAEITGTQRAPPQPARRACRCLDRGESHGQPERCAPHRQE